MADMDKVAEVVEEYEPLAASTTARWRGFATWDKWFELACVIVMALASLAAAWSGYQASAWSGAASIDQTRAADLRMDANRAAMDADVQIMKDISTFDYWTTSYIEGDETMMAFYRARFSPELDQAMNEWLATYPFDTPSSFPSPFELDTYQPPELLHADDLTAQAETLFDTALTKLVTSDEYVLSTVILATVVFFAGLAAKLNWLPARIVAILMSILLLAYGAFQILMQPMFS